MSLINCEEQSIINVAEEKGGRICSYRSIKRYNRCMERIIIKYCWCFFFRKLSDSDGFYFLYINYYVNENNPIL